MYRADAVDHATERIVTASSRRCRRRQVSSKRRPRLAFELFRDAAVDVAVLEVGLGGRLDATNVVQPIAAAITAIDFDHEAFLGDSLEGIAREKAGVIKPGTDRRARRQSAGRRGRRAQRPRPTRRARRSCELAGRRVPIVEEVDGRSRITLSTPHGRYDGLMLALRGRHQIQNALVAIRAARRTLGPAPVHRAAGGDPRRRGDRRLAGAA